MPATTNCSEPSCFNTTHWSVVLAAGGDSSGAHAALEELCRTYWYPLYAFARRSGHGPHDAEDLIQSFFALALRKNFWSAADQSKGRFRSFLLVALKRFLANEWTRARAQKRGGGQGQVSLDALSAEERYAIEPAGRLTPEKLFERRWALTVLDRVLARLQEEQRAEGSVLKIATRAEGSVLKITTSLITNCHQPKIILDTLSTMRLKCSRECNT